MIGAMYAEALADGGDVELERADGTVVPLAVQRWFRPVPGDESLLERCRGSVLDVGSGPGRLTVELATRGYPALGIDLTEPAVEITRRSGGVALCRDVFRRVPGTGRWDTVLLADGNVGIGGDPVALLRRVSQLARPGGRALVEVACPGTRTRIDVVRLRRGEHSGEWFSWADVGDDDIAAIAARAGLDVLQRWECARRWFASLG